MNKKKHTLCGIFYINIFKIILVNNNEKWSFIYKKKIKELYLINIINNYD